MPDFKNRVDFGRVVLGPVFADFALRLWTLMSSLDHRGDTALLFCARGGLRLRLIYERFLAATGLPSPVVFSDLMVSRVVAARVALAAGCASAFEQIDYEMGSLSLRGVASAIGGVGCVAESTQFDLERPYSQTGFDRLLKSEEGQTLWTNILRQADLFRDHLDTLLAGRTRPILCDTGLSGSTMRLLEDGLPHLKWGCALFARSNYKNLPTPHYARTIGLSVQSERYSPLDRRTAILRYWHLIEAVLEPDLASVSSFDRDGGVVRSNLEVANWQSRVDPGPDEILRGIVTYIDDLPRDRAVATILADVPRAYVRLRRAIIRPTVTDISAINIGSRSFDFGRIDEMTGPACETGLRRALRGSLWREGAVSLASPSFSRPILAGIEIAYATRWMVQSVRRRSIS